MEGHRMTQPQSLIKPATLDLAQHIGVMLATATGDKLATAQRIFAWMTPSAKARATYAASTATLVRQ